jgi:hypothetical protein
MLVTRGLAAVSVVSASRRAGASAASWRAGARSVQQRQMTLSTDPVRRCDRSSVEARSPRQILDERSDPGARRLAIEAFGCTDVESPDHGPDRANGRVYQPLAELSDADLPSLPLPVVTNGAGQ